MGARGVQLPDELLSYGYCDNLLNSPNDSLRCVRPRRSVIRERRSGLVMTNVPSLAREWHKSKDSLYELAKREEDPLPVRFLEGDRYGAILVSEFDEWFKRNGALMNERK